MIGKLFCKLIGEQIGNSSSGSLVHNEHNEMVLGLILLLIVLIGLSIWFFCACHGWIVVIYPAFAAFPRWAFVLLMFMFTNRSNGGSSK